MQPSCRSPQPSKAERGKKRVQRANHPARPGSRVAELAAESEERCSPSGSHLVAASTRHGVRWRERNGRLHRIHDGIYAVGHPNISQKGRFIAAVKACNPDAALSHRSEAARRGIRALGLGGHRDHRPCRHTKHHPGILAHRSAQMTRRDLMVREGMLVTNEIWTVVALAAVLPPPELRSAVKQALGMQIVNIRSILESLERLGPVRGSRNLRDSRPVPCRRDRELEDVVDHLISRAASSHPR